jgi:hypothetical protein
MTALLPEMKLEIIRAVGETISEEMSQLINMFFSSTEAIQGYFSQLRD